MDHAPASSSPSPPSHSATEAKSEAPANTPRQMASKAPGAQEKKTEEQGSRGDERQEQLTRAMASKRGTKLEPGSRADHIGRNEGLGDQLISCLVQTAQWSE